MIWLSYTSVEWPRKRTTRCSSAVTPRCASPHLAFEEHIVRLAQQRGCIGVMCGYIHTPADKWIGGIYYLNSGDWVESLTAVVEHVDGRFELINFEQFRVLFPTDETAVLTAEYESA